MKHIDLENCTVCNKGVCHDKQIQFYRVKIDNMIIDSGAVQRAHGLELMMGGGIGGAVLGEIMGPNEDLAKELSSHTGLVCFNCACNSGITSLAENMGEK